MLSEPLQLSLDKIIDYLESDEEKDFIDWLADVGYGLEEIQEFESMNELDKMKFMKNIDMRNHIYFHILNLKSSGVFGNF